MRRNDSVIMASNTKSRGTEEIFHNSGIVRCNEYDTDGNIKGF